MRWFELQWGLLSLLFIIALTRADPTPAIAMNNNPGPKPDSASKRAFWDNWFNWGNKGKQPNNALQGGYPYDGNPCYPIPTTTQTPIHPAVLCPLRPTLPPPPPPTRPPPPPPPPTLPPPPPPTRPPPPPPRPEPRPCGPQPLPNCNGIFVPPPGPPYGPGPWPPIGPPIIVPTHPTIFEPITEPSVPYPSFTKYCAGVPPGPFIPPSFFLADSVQQQQHCRDTCRAPPMDAPPCAMMDVLDQLRLRTIFTLIQQAGLEPLFQQTTRYTLFAPVDAAFEKLPGWFMQSLRDDIKLLRAFILNHFVKDKVTLPNIGNEFRILNARAGGHRLRINVYHQQSEYRVYTVDGSQVLLGDLPTTNDGVLHIVNKVLVPNPPRLISEYLTELPDLKLFMNAVMESGLLPMLQDSETPITLFIPYNHAFKHFDYEAIAGNKAAIQNFVLYHMVNGTIYSPGALQGQYLTTNYNKEIKLSVSSDGFTKYLNMLNGQVEILKSDIPMRNGVVHIIKSCATYSREFLFDAEVNEFSFDFGTFKRSMTLNKKELEKDF